ncbi:hypothetical protein IW262DRAFT_1294100 [Armillaria fumosa]|nr:hypothetical protein IW262DRAFT_1294100 [Armillaria fumosa]
MVTPQKDVKLLFLPSNKDDVLTLVPAPASQVSSDLAALLGDNMRGSSPEPDDAHSVLCLPDTAVAPYRPGPDLSKPNDPTLCVMQPELMEDHLVTLGVYASLPSLGVYHVLVPTGSLVEAFKFDRYGCFVNLAHVPPSILSLERKLLHVSGSTAMCMTVSLVTECMLFEPAYQGGCSIYVETTCISNQDSSACSSPAKGQWRLLTKKTLSTETVSPGSSYPTLMGFMDEGTCIHFTAIFFVELCGSFNQLSVTIQYNRQLLYICICAWLEVFFLLPCGSQIPVFNRFNNGLEDAVPADIKIYTEDLEGTEFLDQINNGKHHYY